LRTTLKAVEVLEVIDAVSRRNKYGVAPMKEIIDVLAERRPVKPATVRKMVWSLGRRGLASSPILGCWVLTEEGRKLLSEVAESRLEGGGEGGRRVKEG
jgi:Mn-dependent DtxR family transcriptional regulator